MSEQTDQPTEEELQAALEEQMRNIQVEDIVLQTTATLVNLGARRLGLTAEPGTDASDEIDLSQAKLAIDAARALAPMCGEEQGVQIQQALSQLQMAYVQAAGPAEGGDPVAGDAAGESPAPPAEPAEDAERARARSKIWTPGS